MNGMKTTDINDDKVIFVLTQEMIERNIKGVSKLSSLSYQQ